MAERLRSAMRGEPYDRALDRVRRMVGERRFALGVQLIAAHRDPLDLAEGYSDVAEGDDRRARRAGLGKSSRKLHGTIDGRRADGPRRSAGSAAGR